MTDPLPTYIADHELTALLRAAATAGAPLRVQTDEATFVVRVDRATQPRLLRGPSDPERVRSALRNYAGRWRDLDVEAMKAELYRARDAGSRPDRGA